MNFKKVDLRVWFLQLRFCFGTKNLHFTERSVRGETNDYVYQITAHMQLCARETKRKKENHTNVQCIENGRSLNSFEFLLQKRVIQMCGISQIGPCQMLPHLNPFFPLPNPLAKVYLRSCFDVATQKRKPNILFPPCCFPETKWAPFRLSSGRG